MLFGSVLRRRNESFGLWGRGFQRCQLAAQHYFRWNGLSHQRIQAGGGKAVRYRVTYISSGEASFSDGYSWSIHEVRLMAAVSQRKRVRGLIIQRLA